MRFAWLLVLPLLFAAPSLACPEVVVPVDPADPIFRSPQWKRPLAAYSAQRFGPALTAFRSAGKTLETTSARLFQPNASGGPAKNAAIQRFLESTVYANPPALIAIGDRFSFPLSVLWAWADAACRQGSLLEAATALAKVQALRTGPDVTAHVVALALRQERFGLAEQLAKDLPPDAFFTPFVEGRLAMALGRRDEAREKFTRAKLGALFPERSRLIDQWLASLSRSDP